MLRRANRFSGTGLSPAPQLQLRPAYFRHTRRVFNGNKTKCTLKPTVEERPYSAFFRSRIRLKTDTELIKSYYRLHFYKREQPVS